MLSIMLGSMEVTASSMGDSFKEFIGTLNKDQLIAYRGSVEKQLKDIQTAIDRLSPKDPPLKLSTLRNGAVDVFLHEIGEESDGEIQLIVKEISEKLAKDPSRTSLNLFCKDDKDLDKVIKFVKFLKWIPHIKRFTLLCPRIEASMIKDIAEVLKTIPSITKFKLSISDINFMENKTAIAEIAKVIADTIIVENEYITELDLFGNGLGEVGVETLINDGLIKNTHIVDLNLSLNGIGNDEVETLVKLLDNNAILKKINLSRNNFDKDVIARLERIAAEKGKSLVFNSGVFDFMFG